MRNEWLDLPCVSQHYWIITEDGWYNRWHCKNCHKTFYQARIDWGFAPVGSGDWTPLDKIVEYARKGRAVRELI